MSAPRRLLVLDDEEAIGRTIVMVADRLGIAARWTETSDEFLSQFDDWAPSHVVLDLKMPDRDGIEVMHLLAERGCSAALIISSGVGPRVLDAARRSAAEHGLTIAAILPKPFSVADLRTALAAESSPVPAPRPPGPARSVIDETSLRAAIAAGHLTLEFQPKIECASLEIVGFEALVRWDHPELGRIMPDEFIGLAERCGAIHALTDEVVRMGVRWLAAEAPRDAQRLAVNLSALSLGDPGLTDRLLDHCRHHGVDSEWLTLEITETGAMTDATAVLDALTRCRVKGFRLAIDDFGVGYSSLVQLARLPFSELKIDRSFVMTAIEAPESRTIVAAVIGLGRSLGLSVTAEGVEDEGALRLLSEAGCDHAQGYHIARPLPPSAVLGWCAEWRAQRQQRSGQARA